jgi:hypothetical protein
MWHALHELARPRSRCSWAGAQQALHDFRVRHRAFRGRWSRTPELAALGYALIEPQNPLEVRVEGCIWLTEHPSRETVARLAWIALDRGEPLRLRDQATWTLGFRQLQGADDASLWTADAIEAADDALLTLWRGPDRDALTELRPALRHVSAPRVLDALAEDALAAAPALEAFATESLARALLAQLAALPSGHAPRLVRLIGHALGPEVVPALLGYAETATLAERQEALMTSLALDAAAARPAVDRFLGALTFDRVARERAAWHEANPGVLPTVRALAIARTTATIEPNIRAIQCREAAAQFAALGTIEPFAEQYLHTMWSRVALGARDHDALRACIDATPDLAGLLERAQQLLTPYLDALAAAGRFDRLATTARRHGETARATWLLATHGLPFAALSIQRLATDRAPEAIAGGAIALFLAGRPDLAERALARETPRAELLPGVIDRPFPGPDERWRVIHEPEACPALVALLEGGLPALLGQVKGAPEGADPDAFDLELLAARERDLTDDWSGATVCLLGTVEDHASVVAKLAARGARLVDGPFGKVDYLLEGAGADPSVVARLRALGVRPLPPL